MGTAAIIVSAPALHRIVGLYGAAVAAACGQGEEAACGWGTLVIVITPPAFNNMVGLYGAGVVGACGQGEE